MGRGEEGGAVVTPETLPNAALELFKLYAKDAGNWSGTPLIGGNVNLLGPKQDRGLLSYIKRAGLANTNADEFGTWLYFTPLGVEFARSLGIEVRS